MNTLRARITTLLVASVLSVVILATGLSLFLLEPPRLHKAIDATAAQIALSISLAKAGSGQRDLIASPTSASPDSEVIGMQRAPASGTFLEAATRDLRDELRKRGFSADLAVTELSALSWPVASLDLGHGRWLVVPIAIPPPPENASLILGGWMLLVATGTTLAAIAAAYSMTRPLALVEKALAGLTLDGELPHLQERGPAEVKSTARAINLLSARLKIAMESRMRLVAAAGHDLRTPLTRLRLRAEFLDEEERRQWLTDLNELDHIADSAIRLVREEVDESALEEVRLDVLTEEIVVELKEMKLKAAVMSAEVVSVRARPLSLKRAFRNLMINAATHGGGTIVSVRKCRHAVLLLIEDDGPGIPEDLLQRAYEPFFRIDPARRASVPGAGLGLAIAREIIARSKGELKITNRPEGGLRQEVSFPVV
jgi:signal transduction histidine kinase